MSTMNSLEWRAMATILIIGSGGREHALARSLADDDGVDRVICAPGNAGTEALDNVVNWPHAELREIVASAAREDVDLVVIGPERPLIDGMADELRRRGMRVVGFGRSAAQLAGSKIHAKRFMGKYGIPTPAFRVFTHPNPALCYLDVMWADDPRQTFVIKADEPCRGQGSFPVESSQEARRVLRRLLTEQYCRVGEQVIIEEGIAGRDASLTVLTDGQTLLTLPPTHVAKRVDDGDAGPNTKGMGAFAPASLLDDHAYGRVESEILLPTLDGMHAERMADAGVLDIGLMIDPKGKPYALEYNVRLGDPQTQALTALLESDLYPVLSACADGELNRAELHWRDGAAVSVVLCVEGYPDELTHQNEPIAGFDEIEAMPDIVIDHNGTDRRRGQLVTRGDRILTITGTGPDLSSARETVYEAIGSIRFRGMCYRTDIAAPSVPA